MAFVEVSQQTKGASPTAPAESVPAAETAAPEASSSAEKSDEPATPPAESESRKKFTKSYGA
jgi:hypothetical protein